MKVRGGAALTAAAALGLAAFALARAEDAPKAPAPAKTIDAARFYVGRWYEIARTPMSLTKDCVAGTTDYLRDAHGRLIDRDACRQGAPDGKEKVFAGPVTILNPGENTKVAVHYKVFGIFTATKTYWMLDHGDDYQWFIVSDPELKMLSLFTRTPRPPKEEVDALLARAKTTGYDVSKLEFPTQFPPGQGAAEP